MEKNEYLNVSIGCREGTSPSMQIEVRSPGKGEYGADGGHSQNLYGEKREAQFSWGSGNKMKNKKM